MAVGYHKLNTSASRSRRSKCSEKSATILITDAGAKFKHPIYGDVITLEPFVSNRDSVKCLSTSGNLLLSGGFIREWMKLGVVAD